MTEAATKSKGLGVQNANAGARRVAFDPLRPTDKPQEFYDGIKQKFADERDLRLRYRPEGTKQYTSELSGELARYESDPFAETCKTPRRHQRHRRSLVHRRRLLGLADGRTPARQGR